MNNLKAHVRNTLKIDHFLVYADNTAVGFFKKQGFTPNITLPLELWKGYIKDYSESILMQVRRRDSSIPSTFLVYPSFSPISITFNPNQPVYHASQSGLLGCVWNTESTTKGYFVRHFWSNFRVSSHSSRSETFSKTIESVWRWSFKFHTFSNGSTPWYEGGWLEWEHGFLVSFEESFEESYCPPWSFSHSNFLFRASITLSSVKHNHTQTIKAQHLFMRNLVEDMRIHRSSYPFLTPVLPSVVGYYTSIKDPMDLETLGNNVMGDKYSKLSRFIRDVEKIFSNCRKFNGIKSE